jgi:hypothetical protein
MLAFAGVTYAATRIFDESEEAYVKALAEQVSLVRMIALLSSQRPVSHSTRTL